MIINLRPIAYVKNDRIDIIDDNWGETESEIILEENIDEKALNGIEEFSHLEIIFYMDKVNNEKTIAQDRHPRNNTDLPKVGTFAQRNKNRPNKIGLSTVKLIHRDKRKLIVKYLDALNNTPVLDIKPVMKNFQNKEEIIEPKWVSEIMKNYW